MDSLAVLAAAWVERLRARSAPSMKIGRTDRIVEAGPIASLRTERGEVTPEDPAHGR